MGVLNPTVSPANELWRMVRNTGVVPQDGGATTTLFTVTGDVIVKVFGICKTALTSGGAIQVKVGAAGIAANVIPGINDAKDLIANDIWQDFAPDQTVEPLSDAVAGGIIILNGQGIILTPSGTFTAGVIDFYCTWKPLSVDGNVVAA